jgi:hypothetical protein
MTADQIRINKCLLDFYDLSHDCKKQLIKYHISTKGADKKILKAVQILNQFENNMCEKLLHLLEVDPDVDSKSIASDFGSINYRLIEFTREYVPKKK